jgi:hypothetical protein
MGIVRMARLISICGMGGGFMAISPKLRMGVSHVFDVTATNMNDWAPYSYIVAAIGIFAILTLSLHKSGRSY